MSIEEELQVLGAIGDSTVVVAAVTWRKPPILPAEAAAEAAAAAALHAAGTAGEDATEDEVELPSTACLARACIEVPM